MQKKKGVSLIVLVITIIVMIILAAAVVISLNNSGIIGKAQDAVKLTNEQEARTILSTAVLEYDLEKRNNSSLTLADYLRSKSWCKSVTEDEGTLIVEIEQGKYDITVDREIRVHDETVAKLKEKYQMAYYTSFESAVTDVNSGVTTNGTVTESEAVAGVYTDEQGIMNIVLLKSTTEEAEIDVTNSTNINLGGRTLTFTKNGYLNLTGENNISINGTINGSKIEANNLKENSESTEYQVIKATCNTLNIYGGTYIIDSELSGNYVISINDGNNKFTINSASISINSSGLYNNVGIYLQANNDNNEIINCDIQVFSNNDTSGDPRYGIVGASPIVNIKNTKINVSCKNYGCIGISLIANSGNWTIDNCQIDVSSTNMVKGISNINSSTKISNSVINANSDNNTAYGVYNHKGKIEVTNLTIFADAQNSSAPSGKIAIGIHNSGTLTFNSGTVFGTHSGMSCNKDSKTYVYGGEFASPSHGGIYFSQGANGEAYVENAVLKRLSKSEYKGKYDVNNMLSARGSIYIGGGTAESCSNMSVYMDNCTLSGGPIVLRGTDSETGNKLYISNSTSSAGVRIDNDNLKIYSGVGNTLNVSSTYSSRVESTNVSYKRVD